MSDARLGVLNVWNPATGQYETIPALIGEPGEDGFSPEASVERVTVGEATGSKIVIQDKNGITEALVYDGAAGRNGNDGFSPSVSVSKTGSITTVTISDKTGTSTAEVHDGSHGERGYSGLCPAVSVPCAAEITVMANTLTRIAALTCASTIMLGDPVDGFDNEWAFEITQGETAMTVTLPVISWLLGIAPTFAANSVTQVRLFYKGSTLMGEWL